MASKLPLAYFITWSCYGARLHGDPRGTVDRFNNCYDTPMLSPSPARVKLDLEQMAEPPLVLSAEQREIVTNTISRHVELRSWLLLALNVRTTHVHVVLQASVGPEKVMGELKAWPSRRLRESGSIGSRTKVWTPHGSTRYLWDEPSVNEEVHYVLYEQDGRA